MNNYYKVLQYFVIFNITTGSTIKNAHITKKTIGVYVTKKTNLFTNPRTLLRAVYKTINLVNIIIKQGGVVLFVGSSAEVQKFYFFYKSRYISQVVFINKWLPGFLTNWEGYRRFLNTVINLDLTQVKQSKKLKFFRFFRILQNKPKPDLVLFFDTINAIDRLSISQECTYQNIPLVTFGSFTQKEFNTLPYKVTINPHNLYNQWFFCQLFFGQCQNNAK